MDETPRQSRPNRGQFVKGEKRPGQGGSRPGAGRKKREEEISRAVKKQLKAKAHFLAAEMCMSFLQDYLGAGACVFVEAATGVRPKGSHLRGKKLALSLSHNSEFMKVFVSSAPRKVDVGLADTAEDFLAKVMSGAYRKKPAGEEDEAQIVNPNQIEDKSK